MGCWIMAAVTFREAAKKKILLTAAIAGLAFLAIFAIGLHYQIEDFGLHSTPPFIRYQILSAMLMVGLYTVDLLSVVMTILTSVDTLAGEISPGLMRHGPKTALLENRNFGCCYRDQHVYDERNGSQSGKKAREKKHPADDLHHSHAVWGKPASRTWNPRRKRSSHQLDQLPKLLRRSTRSVNRATSASLGGAVGRKAT